jgi:hypothetical protein
MVFLHVLCIPGRSSYPFLAYWVSQDHRYGFHNLERHTNDFFYRSKPDETAAIFASSVATTQFSLALLYLNGYLLGILVESIFRCRDCLVRHLNCLVHRLDCLIYDISFD